MKKKGISFFFIVISIIFIVISIIVRYSGTKIFYSLSTLKHEAFIITSGYANTNKVLWASSKNLLPYYFNSYFITIYLLLLPSITLLTIALSNLFKNKNFSFINILAKKSKKKTLIIILALSFIILLIGHIFILHRYTFVSDERSYVFQGNLIASGKLYAQSPPSPEHFTFDGIICNGKWYSKYTIGWPFILAIGKILHISSIMGCICALFSLYFLFLITKQLFGNKAGFISIILAILSPFFVFLAGSYYPHTAFGLTLLIYLYSLLNIEKDDNFIHMIAAGISLIFALNIRAADGGVMWLSSFPLMGYLFFKSKKRQYLIKRLIGINISFFIGLGIIMIVNKFQTGNPFVLGYSVFNPEEGWGFGVSGHNPARGLWHLLFSMIRNSFWVVPFLPILTIFAYFTKDKNKRNILFLLAIIILAYYAFNFGLFGMGMIGYGARFYYASFLIILILSSGGLINIAALLSKKKIVKGPIFLTTSIILIFIYMTTSVYGVLSPFLSKNHSTSKKLKERILDPPEIKEKSIIFLQSSPSMVCSENTYNNWDYKNQKKIIAYYFSPEENEKLIKQLKDRKPYLEYYDFKKKKFFVVPYCIDKNDPKNYLYAGVNYGILLNPDNVPKAKKSFKKAWELAPNNYNVNLNLAAFYFQNKKYKEALKTYVNMIKKFPKREEGYFYAGRCYGILGDKKMALKTFEYFIKNFPKSQFRDKAIDWYIYYLKPH